MKKKLDLDKIIKIGNILNYKLNEDVETPEQENETGNTKKTELSDEDKKEVNALLIAKKGQSVPDKDIHDLADKLNIETDKVESYVYEIAVKYLTQNEEIEGGKADGKTLEDIAKKHNVNIDDIQKEFEVGVEVEQEHTSDLGTAEEIAKDHLFELPDYYTRLVKAKIVDEIGALELYKELFKNETN